MTGSADTAVILAQAEDVHARSVAKQIELCGARALILDTAHYPTAWTLSSKFSNSSDFAYAVCANGELIPGDRIAGVWWRRPRTHEIPEEVTDARVKAFCVDEARAALQGWAYSLGSSLVNPLTSELAASRKPYQLRCAAEVGLTIPDTVVTNDAGVASRFISEHPNGAIFKVLTGTSWQITETREFVAEYSEQLGKLRLAPAIFQQLVARGVDVRVNIVDEEIFAVSIHANHAGAALDWRLDVSADMRPYSLPTEVGNRLRLLMRKLDLRYGAVDMRVTPEGQYYFLEVNPGGQFLFCEIHADVPISRAFAHALLGAGGVNQASERRLTVAPVS